MSTTTYPKRTGILSLPEGGTTGQALVKNSDSDYDLEWADVGGAGSNIFMFSGTNSSITGYESAIDITQFTATTTQSISQTVTTTPTLLEEFATPSGYPATTVIPIGLMAVHYETQKASGGQSYYTYAEIYKRNTGGTETLLATTDYSSSTTVNTLVQTTVTAYLSSNVTLAITDRLVVKVYAVLSTSSVSITLYWDNNTNARLQIPTVTSGLNTGDVTLTTIGSSPNANAASLSGQQLQLQPASASFGGVVSTTSQQFTGQKEFFTHSTSSPTVMLTSISSQTSYLLYLKNNLGTQLGGIDVSGKFIIPLGTASAPGMAFFGATTTGIYNPSGNQLAISTTGSRRINVDGNGYVTIGGDYGSGWATVQIQNSTFPTVNPTFAVKLYSGQSTDLVQITNTSSTPRVGVTKDFYTYFGNNGISYANTSNFFASMAAANHLIVMRGATAQSGDMLRFIDVADTLLSSFDNSGNWQANSKNIYKLTNIIDNSSVTTILATDRMLVDDTGKKALQWLDSGRLLKDNTEANQMEWNTNGIKIHNKVYHYNGNNGDVETNCIPYIVGKFSAIGTTIDYTAQTIYTPQAGKIYRISAYIEITGTGGTTDLYINWTSSVGSESRKMLYLIDSSTTGTLIEPNNANGAPTAKQGTMTTMIRTDNTDDITFTTSWSGGIPTHNIYIFVERIL